MDELLHHASFMPHGMWYFWQPDLLFLHVVSDSLANRLALADQATIAFNQDELERCLEGHTVFEPDLSNSVSRFPERLARIDLRSLVSAPLIFKGNVVGSLFCARRAKNGFTENDREFLTMLACHLSLAINHARRYASLRHQPQ